MARSHLLVMASWASLAIGVGAASACGDPGTGEGTPDPGVDAGKASNKDAGADGSVQLPPRVDSGGPDTNVPDTSGIDGGLPSASPLTLDFGEVDCGKTGTAQTVTI